MFRVLGSRGLGFRVELVFWDYWEVHGRMFLNLTSP